VSAEVLVDVQKCWHTVLAAQVLAVAVTTVCTGVGVDCTSVGSGCKCVGGHVV
jgi:hypothetical protein